MFSAPRTSKIFVFHDRVSFHRQIDGLAAVVRQQMGRDPLSGSYFVFCSRSGRSARILYFDGSGYNLLTRRLSKSIISGWPKNSATTFSRLFVKELHQLLWGEDF